jgi:serine/threonine protein kinase
MNDFSDIWSLGVILYKIIFKKHPLMVIPSNYPQRLNSFLKGEIRIDFSENERSVKFAPVIDLLKRMLACSRNKEMRIRWN